MRKSIGTLLSTAALSLLVGCQPPVSDCQEGELCGEQRLGGLSCGNGSVELGEECDDENDVPGDGCENNCTRTRNVCGDAIVDEGEVCDDGNALSGDGCRSDCVKVEICGDGDLDAGEACDDGLAVSGDGCRADCQGEELCGDGLVDVVIGEVCDDGNNEDGDGCSWDCASGEVCGDGVVGEGEECDDGNSIEGDSCDTNCTAPSCGNGIIDQGLFCFSPRTGVNTNASSTTPAFLLTTGDLEGDGDIDAIVMSGSLFWTLVNNGAGVFTASQPVEAPPHPGYSAVAMDSADFEGDGDLDLVIVSHQNVMGVDRSFVRVLLNQQSSFEESSYYASMQFDYALINAIYAEDLDADGDAELIYSDLNSEQLGIAQRLEEAFYSHHLILSGFATKAVAFGDLNGDGLIDLATLGAEDATQQIKVLRNNGGLSLTERSTTVLPPYYMNADLALLDFDQDGDLDVGAVAYNGTTNAYLFANNGSALLSFSREVLLGVQPMGMSAVGDFNADGSSDLAFAAFEEEAIIVVHKEGDGASATTVSNTNASPYGIGSGDFNNDGIDDLIVSGDMSVTVHLSNP